MSDLISKEIESLTSSMVENCQIDKLIFHLNKFESITKKLSEIFIAASNMRGFFSYIMKTITSTLSLLDRLVSFLHQFYFENAIFKLYLSNSAALPTD